MSRNTDEWAIDMQSRLFWITVMFEVMLADEFALPSSNLFNHEDQVPLPKFVAPKHQPDAHRNEDIADGSFFHYHFLSQIAHRILLTRIRDSLFFSCEHLNCPVICIMVLKLRSLVKATAYPLPALEEELTLQLETWRQQLPPGLWFDTDAALPTARSQSQGSAAAWLRARYIIAKYHIGRPLL